MNSLNSQSQKQFLRRKEELRYEKRNYCENLSLGECARVPFSFVKRYLSLCNLVLSTQITISFCLVACQTCSSSWVGSMTVKIVTPDWV